MSKKIIVCDSIIMEGSHALVAHDGKWYCTSTLEHVIKAGGYVELETKNFIYKTRASHKAHNIKLCADGRALVALHNGDIAHTSTVCDVAYDTNGDVSEIKTRNSVYRVA